ncbi:hypothetical protein E3U43_003392 [Larimichthys crocea]|uniref:Uncharacterized protein n=1 Tax=Larimichthys crocea TaxID=215358 RepID=A0ACD3RHK9_LARCR|nr:hypothetical protein E3U43_003392 [Larimichthys crocea]
MLILIQVITMYKLSEKYCKYYIKGWLMVCGGLLWCMLEAELCSCSKVQICFSCSSTDCFQCNLSARCLSVTKSGRVDTACLYYDHCLNKYPSCFPVEEEAYAQAEA